MRFYITLLAAIVLATTLVLPAAAIESNISKAPVYHKERHEGHDTKTNDVVSDMAFPWPFGRSQGSDAVAEADSDGDGVIDSRDRCPMTPGGALVDLRGCPQDSDRDGVLDGLDQCSNTPRGASVDAGGCPLDSDGDGVFDGLDRCEGTVAGAKVDGDGCVISQMEADLLDTGMIRTTDILFERNSAELKPESRRILDEIGGILHQWPDLEIEISGHTDAVGTDEYNEELSKRRAQTVKEYLLLHFSSLKADHLKAAGYGEGRPVATNDTASGRQENRRVEFKVLNEESLQRSRG